MAQARPAGPFIGPGRPEKHGQSSVSGQPGAHREREGDAGAAVGGGGGRRRARPRGGSGLRLRPRTRAWQEEVRAARGRWRRTPPRRIRPCAARGGRAVGALHRGAGGTPVVGSGSRPASGGEEPRAHGGAPLRRSGEGRTEEQARRGRACACGKGGRRERQARASLRYGAGPCAFICVGRRRGRWAGRAGP